MPFRVGLKFRYNLRLDRLPCNLFIGTLAQLVEQRTFNPLVNGSNPLRPTTHFKASSVNWLFS